MHALNEYPITKTDIETVKVCPVCGHSHFSLLSEVENREFVFLATSYCCDCGLVFRSIRPSLEWFKKSWNLRAQSAHPPVDRQLEAFRRMRYAALSERLQNFTSGKSLLDVGTGTGSGLFEFQRSGWKVTGVEPDVARARQARDLGLKVSAEIAGLEQQEFDVVTIIHVLEHFHEPKEFILQAVKNLKADGFLYVEVPDLKSFVNWQDSLYLEHMSNFTDSNLVSLLAELGFAPVCRFFPKTKPFGAVHLGILFKKTSALPKKPKENDLSLAEVQKLYSAGLAETKNFPLRIRVDGIFDICMTLSRIPYPEILGHGELILSGGQMGIYKKRIMQAKSLSWRTLFEKGLGRMKFLKDSDFVKLRFKKMG